MSVLLVIRWVCDWETMVQGLGLRVSHMVQGLCITPGRMGG